MTEFEVRKIFAQNLKRLRKQRCLSQLNLANELQMAMTFINDIENCKKWVSPETLAKFATFFNIPISELFADENSKNTNQENFIKIVTEELHEKINEVAEKFDFSKM